jgi:ABC-2 type transport system ATP-binding protein
MQQKVMLVIGFLLKADIYIVDEPFMGLDPRAIRDFSNTAATRKGAAGAGVLMSTHALDTAEKVCNSIILMSEGRLIMKGSLDEIRRNLQACGRVHCWNVLINCWRMANEAKTAVF